MSECPRLVLSLGLLGIVASGCYQPACPSERSCAGACTGNAERCVIPGEGCACVGGCWRPFYDGPCAPPRDGGVHDAGRACRPTMFPSLSGPCDMSIERRCVGFDGCICAAGCWSCVTDLCRFTDAGPPIDVSFDGPTDAAKRRMPTPRTPRWTEARRS